VATYPARLAGEVEELDAWLGPAVNHGVQAATGDDAAARTARVTLRRAFADLDARLATSRYLLGDALTEADVRLWVTLARFDVGPNARRDIVAGLHDYPNLWAYARELYRIPAFRETTDFSSFAVPGSTLPDWDEPVDRHFGRVAVA
jgi:putative glutathione S-transferase